MKRGHSEQRVDLVFLLGQRRMLTKTEYAGKLLAQSYTRYQELYYQRRFLDIFELYKGQVWFAERYLADHGGSDTPTPAGNRYIVIEDIAEGMSEEEAHKLFGNRDDVLGISIVQKGMFNHYRRDVYAGIAPECDAEAYINAISDRYRAFVMDLSSLRIEEICKVSLTEAKDLYRALCRLSRKDLVSASIVDECSVETVLGRIREEFLYCTICAKQYDNRPAMFQRCSRHEESDFSYRNIELATTPKDFSKVSGMQEDDEISRYAVATPEETFRCKVCQKLFQGADFVYNHIRSKHADLMQDIERKVRDFQKFMSNVDCFILEVVEGTADRRMPLWGRGATHSELVAYDHPQAFTGEIHLKK